MFWAGSFKGLLIFILLNGSLSVRRVTTQNIICTITLCTNIASMFGHTCTITTYSGHLSPGIRIDVWDLMSGTWCWRWCRGNPLTLSIRTMDHSLGPILGNIPVRLTASPTRQYSIYTIHHQAQESIWILVSTGQEQALTKSRISSSQGALLNSELSASACCGPNHQDVTSSWGAFIRFLRCMSTTERIHELHTERGRAWREAWRSCRLWCWFIIFWWRASKQTKETSMMMLPSMSSSHKAQRFYTGCGCKDIYRYCPCLLGSPIQAGLHARRPVGKILLVAAWLTLFC